MNRDILLNWIEKADEDIKVVEILTKEEYKPVGAICFHSQQAVEKYLKAYLVFIDEKAPRIHELDTLLYLCLKYNNDFEKLDINKISRLTDFAVDIRYPDGNMEPTIDEADEAYNTAIEVKLFVLKKLGK